MDWCKRKPTAPPTCLCVCARRRARRCGKVGHLLEGGRLRGPSQRRQWSEPGIWPVSPPTLPLFVRRGGAVFARVHLRKAQPCARGGWQNRPQNSLAPSGASWDATRRFLGGRFLGLRVQQLVGSQVALPGTAPALEGQAPPQGQQAHCLPNPVRQTPSQCSQGFSTAAGPPRAVGSPRGGGSSTLVGPHPR